MHKQPQRGGPQVPLWALRAPWSSRVWWVVCGSVFPLDCSLWGRAAPVSSVASCPAQITAPGTSPRGHTTGRSVKTFCCGFYMAPFLPQLSSTQHISRPGIPQPLPTGSCSASHLFCHSECSREETRFAAWQLQTAHLSRTPEGCHLVNWPGSSPCAKYPHWFLLQRKEEKPIRPLWDQVYIHS